MIDDEPKQWGGPVRKCPCGYPPGKCPECMFSDAVKALDRIGGKKAVAKFVKEVGLPPANELRKLDQA